MPRLFAEGTELLDPVTGANLAEVSGAGIVLYLKAAFDVLWNEDQRSMVPPDTTGGEGEGDA